MIWPRTAWHAWQWSACSPQVSYSVTVASRWWVHSELVSMHPVLARVHSFVLQNRVALCCSHNNPAPSYSRATTPSQLFAIVMRTASSALSEWAALVCHCHYPSVVLSIAVIVAVRFGASARFVKCTTLVNSSSPWIPDPAIYANWHFSVLRHPWIEDSGDIYQLLSLSTSVPETSTWTSKP